MQRRKQENKPFSGQQHQAQLGPDAAVQKRACFLAQHGLNPALASGYVGK